jgi:uncharacterized protein
VLLALFLSGVSLAEVEVPKLSHRVTDLTATLDAVQVQTLEASLAAFEAKKGSQIAVLIVETTQPEVIEAYAIRVTEAWKLGRKGVDDGVLLLVAKNDHKLRVEVGYGLEGALNDATAKRIVAEIITPFFKRGEFYLGIEGGVNAIMKVVEGEPLPPLSQAIPDTSSGNRADDFGKLLAGGVILYLMLNLMLRQFFGAFPSGVIVGGLVGVLAWVLMASILWSGLCALVAFILSLLFGAKGFMDNSSHLGGGSVGGWGGGSGGSSSGSDFGGGGGGFGGGGASGDW